MEVFGFSTASEVVRPETGRADEATIALARLIGRQIAREQFEQLLAAERKARRQPRP